MNTTPLKSLLAAVFLAPAGSFAAITLSSADTFSTTNGNWQIGGSGSQPAYNSGLSFDGQPGFVTQFSDGASSNGKWLMWSDQPQWMGDYPSAGISAINFWADNQSGNPLGLRIAFDGPGGWFYSAAQTITNLTADTDWTNLNYALTAANFTHVTASGGTGVFADTMSNVTRLEILGGGNTITCHASGNVLDAGTSVNTVAVDQIAAVPEPTGTSFILGGLIMAAFGMRSRPTSRSDSKME